MLPGHNSRKQLKNSHLHRLYPSRFADHRDDLAAFWREAIADARRDHGRFAVVATVFNLLVDLVKTWLGHPHPSTSHPSPSGDSWMTRWLRDLAHSFKSLRRRPMLTVTSVVSLAIGLSGALAIYAAAHAVLFRPLPFPNADQLVSVQTMVERTAREPRGTSVPDYLDLNAQATASFDGMAAWTDVAYTLRADGPAVRATGEMVTANYFQILGGTPLIGSVFTDRDIADDTPGLVIGEDLWTRTFNRDPRVLGRRVLADDVPFVIVGVMPASFRGLSATADVWVPFAVHGALVSRATWDARGSRWHNVVARLRPGITAVVADREVKTVAARLGTTFGTTNQQYTADVVPMREALFSTVRPALVILLVAVGVVLFMTCVNVANLFVARLSARQQEFAVRTALGATRRRLITLAAADGVVIAALGAAAAAPLTFWLIGVLRQLNPGALPAFATPSLTWPVVGAGVVMTALAAVFIGVASVLALGTNASSGVTNAARGSSESTRHVRLRRALTTVQVACAMTLLTTAVLLGLSFRNVTRIQPGFRTDHLLVAATLLPPTTYTPERRQATKRDLLTALQAQPGIRGVALASDAMLDGDYSASFYTADVVASSDEDRQGRVYVHAVTHNFFEVSGIPILEGTTLPVFDGTLIDSAQPDLAVVVSERLAKRFWPSGSAVGQRVRLGRGAGDRPWMRIAGVVGDTKHRGLPDNPTQDPDLYLPYSSRASSAISIVMHTSVDPLSMVPAVERAVQSVDPKLAVFGTYSMHDQVAASTARQRFLTELSSAFGVVALLLAIVGTYGVVAYQVLLARRAIGIRLALGATPRQIFTTVIGGTVRLVAVGVGFGLVMSVALTTVLADQLYQVQARNVPVFTVVAAGVAVMAVFSAWWPARQAMAVNPVSVLRAEQ